ncbi:ABC transporter permease [Novosphingobium pokkalii]|uniref:ABC transporter permease n=1 Tax=Novosphingobium pokkalii TaxID=1770194 RepID=UPI00363D4A5E
MERSALIDAFTNSLTIAFISMLFSVVLGALTAIALWRFRFPGKGLFDGAVTLPIVVPEICMGVAMLVFFGQIVPWPRDLVWPFDLGAIIIAHITFSFPSLPWLSAPASRASTARWRKPRAIWAPASCARCGTCCCPMCARR